jgi:hypothetical protein
VLVSGEIEERATPARSEPPAGETSYRRRPAPTLVLGSSPATPLRLSLGTRAGLVLQSLVLATGVLLLSACMLGLSAVGFYERWIAGRLAEGWP